ncbi:SprT family protein [uncultured Granulicatella sp.]|uniref:SprT family protein n=1 Tax=uncultured Granulicatella sp. TaxID=316089 RepID=UPI00260ED94A|nr:SprT family protein [uncultured Granulicatella sp.]
MNEHELQNLTEEISRTSFHREFTHKITYNNRLRSSGGRYLLKTGNIEINPLVEQELGLEALIGVIKHELCHYHLHQTGRGYRHQDQDFKQLLHQVGGSRFIERMREPNFIYECTACHHRYPRMRKMNTNRYVCGKCRGKLILLD